MNRARTAGAIIVALVIFSTAPVVTAGTVIKLATLAPDGSVWHQSLKIMGEDWAKASGNDVRLRIYPGGVAGDEPDLIRKMRIGQLHAASLSVTGLSRIDSSFNVFSIPLFYESYDELFFVLEKLEPVLRKKLEAKGFIMMNWGHGGWVHFFTKEPVTTIEQFKSVKMFAWAGDDRWVQWWKNNGFHPVALAATDILTGLQTGMIDGLPSPPLVALSLQYFRHAPYMLDLGLAPLVGATVITERAWNRVPPQHREAMAAAALQVQETLEKEVPEQDRASVLEMEKRGLKVVRTGDGDNAEEWRKAAATFADKMRGDMIPADIFGLAVKARNEYRALKQSGESN